MLAMRCSVCLDGQETICSPMGPLTVQLHAVKQAQQALFEQLGTLPAGTRRSG